MTTNPLNDALEVEPLYEPGERFPREFYEFAYRLNSLLRHWHFTRRFIAGYLTDLRAAKTDSSGEMGIIKDEMLLSDQEYFPDFLRGAVLAHSLTLIENLLADVASEVASELGAKPELDQRQFPYINRHILFLTRTCGLELDVSKDLWKQIEAIRELRNRYIHKLDRDLPLQVKATLSRMADEAQSAEKAVDDAFVDCGLKVVAELAGQLECADWRWFDKREGHLYYLRHLDLLASLLLTAPSKGACVVLASLDRALFTEYLLHQGQGFPSNCTHRTVLGTHDQKTAAWAEQYFGPPLRAADFLSLPPPGPEHGITAFHDTPSTGKYRVHKSWDWVLANL